MPTPRAIRSSIDRGEEGNVSSLFDVGCAAVDAVDMGAKVAEVPDSVVALSPTQVNPVEAITLPVAKNRHLPTLPLLMEGSIIDGGPQFSWSEIVRTGVSPFPQDGRVTAEMEDNPFTFRQVFIGNGTGEPFLIVQSLSE
jgi:hypothetical protein